MKFFKIFKKKPPPNTQHSSNLICNIHWAEVQKELSENNSQVVQNNKNVPQQVKKETAPKLSILGILSSTFLIIIWDGIHLEMMITCQVKEILGVPSP